MNEITDITHSLPAQFINIGKQIAQIIDERLNTIGLSNAKLSAMHSIVSSKASDSIVTVTCVAEAMNTSKSNVTAMVDRLIAEGLVTREQSIEDRRTVVIALTEEGKQRYEAGVEVVQTLHRELSTRFSTEEQHFLHSLMDRLLT